MSTFSITAFCLLVAYLFGSFPTGKIVGKYKGVDIQKKGSGNIGFANAVRVLGWKSGFIVLVGDVTKGFIPTYIASNNLSYQWTLVVALVAVLAHIFPVWLKFNGGKGIATGLGVTLAIVPLVAILGFATYIIGIKFFKKSGPSSVIAAWSLPVYAIFIDQRFIIFGLILALLGTWTHRSNLREYRTQHAK